MIPKLTNRKFREIVMEGIKNKNLKTINEKATFLIEELEKFSSKKEPLPVTVESWETMSKSKASEAIGEDNFALANVKDIICIIDYNSISDENLAKSYFEAIVKAVSRIYNYGLLFENEIYSISHFSTTGRNKAKGDVWAIKSSQG